MEQVAQFRVVLAHRDPVRTGIERARDDEGRVALRFGDLALQLEGRPAAQVRAHDAGAVVVGFRPEHVRLAAGARNDDARVRVRAEVIEYLGDDELLHATVGDGELLALIPSGTDVKVGDSIDLAVAMEKLHPFDAKTENRLDD